MPLFLIHGLGMWSVTWSHNIDALAQHFRVICIDNKGYGSSEKPTDLDQPGYKIEDLKQAITALCDAPAIIVTQSFWGAVALWGEADQWVSGHKGKMLAKRLPNARFSAIADCGHDASSDCPPAVNRAILSFLAAQLDSLPNSLPSSNS